MHVNQARGSEQTATEAGAARGTRYAAVRAAIRRRLTGEHLVVLVAGLLVLVVHDVGYLLSQPFWNDETWVAVTTRFPLSQLPATTSSTPVGWSVLLRLFTVSGEQTSRLLPLAFAGAAVVVGYWLARRLGWPQKDASVAAGLLAAAGVLLVPGMLVRDDLKQFTADACLALLTLALTSRLEREWSRGGLAALSVSAWGGMLFSGAAAFVGVAAFAAVCVVQLARRSWRWLIEAAAAAEITAVLMAGVYEAFDARADTPALTAFFSSDYLPVSRGLHDDLTFVVAQFKAVGGYFGLGPWWLAVPLVAAGLVYDIPARQAGDGGSDRCAVAGDAGAVRAEEIPIPQPADLDVPVCGHGRRCRDRGGGSLLSAAALAQDWARCRAGGCRGGGVRGRCSPLCAKP